MTQSISMFDQTVQETHRWLHEVSEEMGDPRQKIAYHALRGVLFALRDRLPVDEVHDLAAQLPTLIRGIFFEGYAPSGKPEKLHREAFLKRVSEELQKAGGANPENAARAVFRVLGRHVSEGELRELREGLPKDLRSLWPERIPADS